MKAALEWLTHPFAVWQYLIERLVILPAAERLPLAAALFLADTCALLDLAIPSAATRTAWREVAAATGRTGLHASPAVFDRIAMPGRELVYLTRMRAGREHLDAWRITEQHRARVAPLIESGSSFVLAAAHFSSAAIDVAQAVLPSTAAFLVGEAPASAASPNERRRQLADRSRDSGRLGLLVPPHSPARLFIGVPDVWGPQADWGDPLERAAAVRAMVRRLREPGGIVLVRVDAHWRGEGGLERPFAAQPMRRFALGAASVARLAQCPVIPFVAIIERQRTVRVVWGEPIPPPPRDAAGEDASVLSQSLDHLERAIGRYPEHYQAAIGRGRRFDRASRTWREQKG